jgi:hypothetical protein
VNDGSAITVAIWRARGPQNLRRALGLPTAGPVPAGASLTFGPAAYQLREAATDTVTVLILAYLSSTAPGRQAASTVGVYPIQLHWDGGDWKVLRPGASTTADYASLVAQPHTAEAVARGWQGLTP